MCTTPCKRHPVQEHGNESCVLGQVGRVGTRSKWLPRVQGAARTLYAAWAHRVEGRAQSSKTQHKNGGYHQERPVHLRVEWPRHSGSSSQQAVMLLYTCC